MLAGRDYFIIYFKVESHALLAGLVLTKIGPELWILLSLSYL